MPARCKGSAATIPLYVADRSEPEEADLMQQQLLDLMCLQVRDLRAARSHLHDTEAIEQAHACFAGEMDLLTGEVKSLSDAMCEFVRTRCMLDSHYDAQGPLLISISSHIRPELCYLQAKTFVMGHCKSPRCIACVCGTCKWTQRVDPAPCIAQLALFACTKSMSL